MLKFLVAWRKVKHLIWNLPYRTHTHIAHDVNGNIKEQIDKTILIQFIYSCINHTHYMYICSLECQCVVNFCGKNQYLLVIAITFP